MKKYIIAASVLAALTLATSCADDYAYNLGEGRVAVSATLNSDVKVVTRTDADELRQLYGESLTLWLTKPGEGPVRQYHGIDNLPEGAVALPSGSYVAEAWAGDSVSASWDAKYFKAYVPFDVTTGQTTNLDVTLTIANSLVQVSYDDKVDGVVKDFTMEVGHERGTVTFEGRDDRTAYFMMPSTDPDLTLTLTATTLDGKPYTQTAKIENAQPGYLYKVKVTHKGELAAIGGAWFEISVDASEVVVEDQIEITLAPDISGIGFDIEQPVSAAVGSVPRRSVFVSAANTLTGLVLRGELIKNIIGYDDVDLLNASNSSYLTQLVNAGITLQRIVDTEGQLTNMRVNFEPQLTATLPAGEYPVEFTAYDGVLSSQATLTFNITDAALQNAPVQEASFTSATLCATIIKAGEIGSDAGFHYRAQGASVWTEVAGIVSGDKMTATLTGLTPGTTYEYAATSGNGIYTPTATFTTTAPPTLPNAGFESWDTSKNPYLIYSSGQDMFWDSGNHGSATMRKNVTVPDGTYKHSGQYSIKLASQFVGVAGIGKFAAGNVFIGKYLETKGTNGVLGFGRPFPNALTPKGLRGWIRYEPVAVTHSSTSLCPTGSMDTGIIYMALLTNQTTPYNGENWPVIVETADDASKSKLFDRNGSNVVKYGELVITDKTSGSGMIQFELMLDDVNPSLQWSNIMIVASASRYGDYFSGGNGSTMWLDDLELIY